MQALCAGAKALMMLGSGRGVQNSPLEGNLEHIAKRSTAYDKHVQAWEAASLA